MAGCARTVTSVQEVPEQGGVFTADVDGLLGLVILAPSEALRAGVVHEIFIRFFMDETSTMERVVGIGYDPNTIQT